MVFFFGNEMLVAYYSFVYFSKVYLFLIIFVLELPAFRQTDNTVYYIVYNVLGTFLQWIRGVGVVSFFLVLFG